MRKYVRVSVKIHASINEKQKITKITSGLTSEITNNMTLCCRFPHSWDRLG